MISQVENRTSISDLKLKAKDQLLGSYGIATASFALLFALIYAVIMVITSSMTMQIANGTPMLDQNTVAGTIGMKVLSLVIGAFSAILTTGYMHIMTMIADGRKPVVSDLFHVFRNHPDKVIIISFILVGVQLVLLIPANIAGFGGFGDTAALPGSVGIDGRKFLLWVVLYLAGYIISYIIDLYFVLSYLIYLDDPDENVMNIMKRSFEMMKGNCLRFFYMLLTFVGYWMLVIMSLGIAALWVVPYQSMTVVQFYNDLKGSYEY